MVLIKNSAFNEKLKNEGAVVIPFLNTDELQQLRDFYEEVNPGGILPNVQGGFETTFFSPDVDYKLKVHQGIDRILRPACERAFINYRLQSHAFLVKEKNCQYRLNAHQDWSFVDEKKYESFNIWVPLQDTYPKNAGLWHIRGSHKINRPIRGAGALMPDYSLVTEQLPKLITWLPTKAGEAILFYHRTIHGSGPNESEHHRIVANVSLLPAEAPYVIYFQRDPDSRLEEHHPSETFAYYQDFSSQATGPTSNPVLLGYNYKSRPITLEEISETMPENQLQ